MARPRRSRRRDDLCAGAAADGDPAVGQEDAARIEKAIQKSDLGLTPSSDGNVIRLAIPALNEERRRDLVKQVHKRLEEARVAVRNCRRDAIDELRKGERDKQVSEDELKRALDRLQKLTDSFRSRRLTRLASAKRARSWRSDAVESDRTSDGPALARECRITLRSSWMATGGGRVSAACLVSRLTAPAPRTPAASLKRAWNSAWACSRSSRSRPRIGSVPATRSTGSSYPRAGHRARSAESA